MNSALGSGWDLAICAASSVGVSESIQRLHPRAPAQQALGRGCLPSAATVFRYNHKAHFHRQLRRAFSPRPVVAKSGHQDPVVRSPCNAFGQMHQLQQVARKTRQSIERSIFETR
jgi:hypothetical protein